MPDPRPYPDLPIIQQPSPPRRTIRERYGSFFYFGIAGLIVLLLLIGWFAIGVWTLRSIWINVYVLNDPSRTDVERIEAADALVHDHRVLPSQLWELSLIRTLPGLARYRLAESLTANAVMADPSGYAVAVARSADWPDWLRLLLLRPIAYAAGDGLSIPADSLRLLARHADPLLTPWADYALAVLVAEPEAIRALERVATEDGPGRELAAILREALHADEPGRSRLLDRATRWVRDHHPEAIEIWRGWEERDGRLVPDPASNLPNIPAATAGKPAPPTHSEVEPRD